MKPATSNRFVPGKNIGTAKLTGLVRSLGVNVVRGTFERKPGCRLPMTMAGLWSVYEAAKAKHRELVLKHHPDKGGDEKLCTTINSVFIRIEELFRRKYGIPG